MHNVMSKLLGGGLVDDGGGKIVDKKLYKMKKN